MGPSRQPRLASPLWLALVAWWGAAPSPALFSGVPQQLAGSPAHRAWPPAFSSAFARQRLRYFPLFHFCSGPAPDPQTRPAHRSRQGTCSKPAAVWKHRSACQSPQKRTARCWCLGGGWGRDEPLLRPQRPCAKGAAVARAWFRQGRVVVKHLGICKNLEKEGNPPRGQEGDPWRAARRSPGVSPGPLETQGLPGVRWV